MPELPEVETIRIGLESLIVGKTISQVNLINPSSFVNPQTEIDQFLIGSKVIDVQRRAKVLLIKLNNQYVLMTHLKMTGQLVFDSLDSHFGAGHPNDSLIGQLPDKSTRVYLTFNDHSKLYFNDQRKFGWIKLYPINQIDQIAFMKNLGPEPLAKDFTWQKLKARLLIRPKSYIKPVLIDQSILAGVGNIYADETLWKARVNPMTRVNQLSDTKIKQIFESLQSVLRLSLEKGGSTDRNYVNAEGKKGSYLDFASVYGRQGQPCLRCQKPIVKIKLAGRGTHYCRYCQRLVRQK